MMTVCKEYLCQTRCGGLLYRVCAAWQATCRRPLMLCLVVLSAAAAGACGNKPVPAVAVESEAGYSDVAGVKLQTGRPAPEFSLPDYRGRLHALADFRGRSNVMLLFYRGSWCPFCISHLEDIQNLFPTLSRYEIQLLAISPDDAADSQKLAQRFEQPYLFLSDAQLHTADLYGIRRDEKLPHPAVILIDKQGDVVWFYVGENYRQRPSASQLQTVFERVF